MNHKEVYSKDEIKNIKDKREVKALSTLLCNIKEEESLVIPHIKLKKSKFKYNQSFLALSNIQIYRTYSIYGIMKYFNLGTKYRVIDLALLLDIWFNNSQLINKSELLKYDILIIHGKAIEYQAPTKATALIELISVRKTLNRLTWLYMEDTTMKHFNDLYPGVGKTLSNHYQVTIKTELDKEDNKEDK